MRYLVAVDEQDTSCTALKWLVNVLKPQRDEVYLLCASNSKSNTPSNLVELTSSLEAIGVKNTAPIITTGAESKNTVINKVNELKIGTLVLGARIQNNQERWSVGSFLENCVHYVNCPVVVVQNSAVLHI